MKVAYFSTATAIGSCSSYSRFTISGGLLMIDMISPSLFLPDLDAGKTQGEQSLSLFTGLERPPRFPWQRSGVAPAHSGGLPASKLNVAPCATSMLPTTSRHPRGDANGDGEGYVCLSSTRHRGEGSLLLVNGVPGPGRSRRIRAGRA